jgi:putative transposase
VIQDRKLMEAILIRRELTNVQWARIQHLIPGKEGDRGRTGEDNRLFLDAVLWILRTGSPWRDLPDAFGHWNSVFVRFSRWSKKGIWESLFKVLGEDPDFEHVMIDATIIRAHQHAAGAKGGLRKKPLADRAVA